ncbi:MULTISPECIES: helix-hairpin-helix domain-containing protein [unclassified Curtobacterium]|uniref:helix-hairpin-helix domain-containing protein n=1 Tax=unclassified Curtobacterium TaxID=257496 RepID=UPI000F912D64|nr:MULTISPECIES: helix-hairpin-helix domain-containing protein [unclassified Curtobacterium]ROQ05903.1 competence protein ComEA [Curtobacterium sp. PhB171]ROQ22950.1 competence protein ComEA [Curtobacterium sp. PhB170]ROS34098.1 competence protein ComEA [Curtobacterium sp. PhB131]ROS66697.1 competence protein ComEA [Curtobacterium sp. PhB141]
MLWSRLVLSPRAAVVLAGVVVVVALVVVLVGSLPGRGGAGAGGVVVSDAPTVGAPTAGAPIAGAPTAGSSTAGPASGGEAVASGAARVVVHVLGAVERDGVVRLPPSSRVTDAIERAGGATADADLDRLNLARVLTDGERLYVPRMGEDEVPAALDPVDGGAAAAGSSGGSSTGAAGASGTGADSVVDLNSADQAALETLPGIGPGLAGRILAWRDEHGRFTAVEDLLDVSGIGDVRFAELRDRVRV